MAYLLFNPEGILQCCVKHKEDLGVIRGDVADYESKGLLKEVSLEDYQSVVCREKSAELQDGNIVYGTNEADLAGPVEYTKERFREEVTMSINYVTQFMTRHKQRLELPEFAATKTRLNDFKTALENVNYESIGYPVTSRLLRYWFDNETVEPFTNRYLQ
jgi:hypothetical protein